MPKWKSVLKRKEAYGPDGKLVPGVTVQVPVDDFAKIHPLSQGAVDSGDYVPSSPNEKKNLEKKVAENMIEEWRRKGSINQDQVDALRKATDKFNFF